MSGSSTESGTSYQEADYLYGAVSRFYLSAPRSPHDSFFRREAEERRGVAAGDQGLLREERDRTGSQAGAEEQRASAGLAAERPGRAASQIAAKMYRQFVLSYAADIAVAVATDSHDAALLLGLVSRTGQM